MPTTEKLPKTVEEALIEAYYALNHTLFSGKRACVCDPASYQRWKNKEVMDQVKRVIDEHGIDYRRQDPDDR